MAGIISTAINTSNGTPDYAINGGNTTTAAPAATPDYKAMANSLYQTHLGRDGDTNGLTYWAGQLQSGKSLADVTDAFKSSARGTYQGYLTDPNDPNAANSEISPLLAGDLKSGQTAGGMTGTAQDNARAALNPSIYADLYGTDKAGTKTAANAPTANAGQAGILSTPAAKTYDPALLGDATKWNVTPDQTVEGRVNQLTDPNNPIIQMAMTRAREAQNANGTLNSSMADTAGQVAAYQAALPIAQSDAATAAKAAGYNADEQNQFSVQNANAKNQAGGFNSNAQNTLTGQTMAANTQRELGYLDAQTKTNLAALDAQTRTNLGDIEANYKGLMQSNASSSDLFKQITQNITNISASTTMDAKAKQDAVNNQLALLKNGLTINGSISNLNFGNLLNFSSINANNSAATTAETATNAAQDNVTQTNAQLAATAGGP